jgi:hypothetical protein
MLITGTQHSIKAAPSNIHALVSCFSIISIAVAENTMRDTTTYKNISIGTLPKLE